jgi:hypothetical protein
MSARQAAKGLKYGSAATARATETLDFPSSDPGQRNPQHYPQMELGEPMSIRQVAAVLGCSEWTVRQRYLPLGLPHFRLSRTGKLLFFHNQIVRWVLEKQRQK